MQEFFNSLEFSSFLWQILTPLIFSLADVITGYIQAIINKNVDSSKMRTGLLHKCLIVLILGLSVVISYAFNTKAIVSTISIYILVMETTSIIENLKKAGIDLKGLDLNKNNKK